MDIPSSHTFPKRPFTQYATSCTFPIDQYIDLMRKVARGAEVAIPIYNPDNSLRYTFTNKDVYQFKAQLKKSTQGTEQHYFVVDFSGVKGVS